MIFLKHIVCTQARTWTGMSLLSVSRTSSVEQITVESRTRGLEKLSRWASLAWESLRHEEGQDKKKATKRTTFYSDRGLAPGEPDRKGPFFCHFMDLQHPVSFPCPCLKHFSPHTVPLGEEHNLSQLYMFVCVQIILWDSQEKQSPKFFKNTWEPQAVALLV